MLALFKEPSGRSGLLSIVSSIIYVSTATDEPITEQEFVAIQDKYNKLTNRSTWKYVKMSNAASILDDPSKFLETFTLITGPDYTCYLGTYMGEPVLIKRDYNGTSYISSTSPRLHASIVTTYKTADNLVCNWEFTETRSHDFKVIESYAKAVYLNDKYSMPNYPNLTPSIDGLKSAFGFIDKVEFVGTVFIIDTVAGERYEFDMS